MSRKHALFISIGEYYIFGVIASAYYQLSSRRIDLMKPEISVEIRDKLKGFKHLQTDEEIAEWHHFCDTSPHKLIQGTSPLYWNISLYL